MSQFCGYTLELVLNDPSHTTIRGIIKQIIDKDVVVSNPVYLDGTKYKDKEVTLKGSEITDLRVVEMPNKKNKKKAKKKNADKPHSRVPSQDPASPVQEEKKVKKPKEKKPSQSPVPSASTLKGRNEPRPYESYRASGQDYSGGADWAYDDANEVKKMDDYDFASHSKMFDKTSVFKEISKLDKTKSSQRLVNVNSVNSREKKNFAHDEMVLEKRKDSWDSVADNTYRDTSSSERFTDARENSGQQRQVSHRSTTPMVDTQVKLVYAQSKTDVRTCSPLQLSEIENIASQKFHYDARMLAENSGSAIAQLIVSRVLGSFRVGNTNHNVPPLVLVLAGNNRAGSISLVTGRQLLNHGVRVITYLLHDSERSEDQLLPEVQANLDSFTACSGKVVTSRSQLEQILSQLDSPLEFIVDGLQGYDTDLSDFIEPELSDSNEIVEWCNERDLPVMSVDVPSGVNASTGSSDSGSFLHSKYIVSVGLPLNSILNMYKFGYFQEADLTHFVVDSGIPRKVFTSKSSFRKFEATWFSDLWATEMVVM